MALSNNRALRDNLAALGFIAPAGAVVLVFWLLPVIMALLMSFTNYESGDQLFGDDAQWSWVGTGNYAKLFDAESGDWETFSKVFYNTVNYVLWSVPMTLCAGLGLAMLLNHKLKGMGVYRTLFFLPHVTTWVAVAIVWKFIYNENVGLANHVLRNLLGVGKLGFLAEGRGVVELLLESVFGAQNANLHPLVAGPSLAMFSIILTNVWYDTGYFVIIFLAGLQTIDRANYEAADIDGANAWQKFFSITVPLLSPVLFFLLVVSMINAFKVFIPMFIMTPTGGPRESTMTMVFFLYNKAFGSQKLGYGASIAFVLMLVILTVTLLQRYFVGRKVHYS